MKVAYRKRFLKDLASVPSHLRPPIERFVFEARFVDYRVGLSVTDDIVTLECVLNRKEIYRKFP